jgi:hypothetical protein
MLLLGIHGFIILIDRQNFFTLNGTIQWQRMKKGGRIALICVYCCFWIMSALYLGLAVKLVIEARQQGRALKSHRQNKRKRSVKSRTSSFQRSTSSSCIAKLKHERKNYRMNLCM